MKTGIIALTFLSQLAFAQTAFASPQFCGEIEFVSTEGKSVPQLVVYTSLIFTGQINRFELVPKTSETLATLEDSESTSVCVEGEMEVRETESVIVVDRVVR